MPGLVGTSAENALAGRELGSRAYCRFHLFPGLCRQWPSVSGFAAGKHALCCPFSKKSVQAQKSPPLSGLFYQTSCQKHKFLP